MTLLITGGDGNLGRELVKLLPDSHHPTRQDLDITSSGALQEYINRNAVDSVIHCAANTSVRDCELHRHEAYITNVQGTLNVCSSLSDNWLPRFHSPSQSHRPHLVYVSTACIFPGDSSDQSYSEDDVPYPKNFYAMTKLLGEEVVKSWTRSTQCESLIVRTNFVERGKWKYPKAFVDRYGTYLYADQVAKAITDLYWGRTTGLIHVCGDKRMSMYELARLQDSNVEPTTLKDYVGPQLTVNMSLTSEKIRPIPLA